jgi:hypothetical protein
MSLIRLELLSVVTCSPAALLAGDSCRKLKSRGNYPSSAIPCAGVQFDSEHFVPLAEAL